MDIATYQCTYNYENDFAKNEGFWADPDARFLLLQNTVDEHDYMHRRRCFKKGPECRYDLPKEYSELTHLFEEFSLEDAPMNEIMRWYNIDGSYDIMRWYNIDGSYDETVSYLMQLRWNQGSQF